MARKLDSPKNVEVALGVGATAPLSLDHEEFDFAWNALDGSILSYRYFGRMLEVAPAAGTVPAVLEFQRFTGNGGREIVELTGADYAEVIAAGVSAASVEAKHRARIAAAQG